MSQSEQFERLVGGSDQKIELPPIPFPDLPDKLLKFDGAPEWQADVRNGFEQWVSEANYILRNGTDQ
jgi:hypothetical protein